MSQPRSSRVRPRAQPRLARDLYERRLVLGLTQQGLADLAGVSRTSVQAIEAGKTSVQLGSVLVVADVLGYTVVAVPASDVADSEASR